MLLCHLFNPFYSCRPFLVITFDADGNRKAIDVALDTNVDFPLIAVGIL
jgi:hypothetical protein